MFFEGKVSVDLPKGTEMLQHQNQYPAGTLATYHCQNGKNFSRTCASNAKRTSTTWQGSVHASCDGRSRNPRASTDSRCCPRLRVVPVRDVPVTLKFELISGSTPSKMYGVSMNDIAKFQSAISTACGVPESKISLLNVNLIAGNMVKLEVLFRLAVADTDRVQRVVQSRSFADSVKGSLGKHGVVIARLTATGPGGRHIPTTYLVGMLCLTALLLSRGKTANKSGVQLECIICGSPYVSMTGTTDRCPACRTYGARQLQANSPLRADIPSNAHSAGIPLYMTGSPAASPGGRGTEGNAPSEQSGFLPVSPMRGPDHQLGDQAFASPPHISHARQRHSQVGDGDNALDDDDDGAMEDDQQSLLQQPGSW